MRVCFIVEYYPPHIGGGEMLFQKLAEGLVEAGEECDVITSLVPGSKKFENVKGVNIYRVPVPRVAVRYWFALLSFPSAWSIARRAGVIQTTTYSGAFSAWAVARLQKKPIVIVAHEVLGRRWYELGFSRLTGFFCHLLENVVLHLPYDAYSCNSVNTMRSLIEWGLPYEKLFLAYPGMDYMLFGPKADGREKEIRAQLGIKDSTFVYIYCGRPGLLKGVEYLVEAAPLIGDMIPDSMFLLILSNQPARRYRQILDRINALKVRNIIVLDPVPREILPRYMRASDCVVVPSLNEGFGFTCVEACTIGKPVVATNVGSLPEVIFGKYVLVPPGDARALAHGVTKVFRKEYKIEDEKTFSWEETTRAHLKTYESLVSRR